MAGFVLYDCWTASVGRELDPEVAMSLSDTVSAHPAVAVVGMVTLFGILGPPVALAGPARAGVTGWWLLLPAVGSIGASMALAFSPLPYAGFALLGAVPPVVVGLRMIARSRAERSAA